MKNQVWQALKSAASELALMGAANTPMGCNCLVEIEAALLEEEKRMNETRAREILGDSIKKDNGLYNLGHYMAWSPRDRSICLDDHFTLKELEAIVWWMKEHGA